MPAKLNKHDRVEAPDPVRLVGLTPHDVLFVPRFTAPLKPSRLVTVRVEMPVDPALTVTVLGLPVSAKSCVVYATFVECESEPLVPVTVTLTGVAELKVHDSVVVPEPVRLSGDTEHAVLLVVNPTAPLNPFSAATVTVEVPGEPALIVNDVGLALIVKSCTVNEIVAVCVRLLLDPVTVTV